MNKFSLRNLSKINMDFIILLMLGLLLGLMIFSTAAGQALSILIIILGLIRIIKAKRYWVISNPVSIAFIAFILARILSIFFSENLELSLSSLNKEIFFYLIFFVFYGSLAESEEVKVRSFIKILFIAAIVASVIGSYKVIAGLEERAKSTTSGYSTLGLFLSVIFAIAFSLGKNKNYFTSRIFWIITLLVIAFGILFTFNRSNWVSLAIIITIIGIYKERVVFGFLLIFFLVIIFMLPDLSERFYQLIHFKQYLSDRDIIWKGATMIWDQHPVLGFGTKTFKEIFPLHSQLADKGVGGWHNEFLHIYIESGLLGLSAYIALLVSIYYSGIKALKKFNMNGNTNDLVIASLAGFTVFYLNALSSGFILDPINKLLFMFLLALHCTLIYPHGSKS